MNRRAPSRKGRSGVPLTESDLLAGASLNEDQKAAIEKIHRDMKARMELVAKDEKETSDQKDAMLQGLYRMQMRQVFDVLTPEQRAEARKRIFAARSTSADNRNPQPANKSSEAH
jgi:hypothetical protein